jgi:hypothetical protein
MDIVLKIIQKDRQNWLAFGDEDRGNDPLEIIARQSLESVLDMLEIDLQFGDRLPRFATVIAPPRAELLEVSQFIGMSFLKHRAKTRCALE